MSFDVERGYARGAAAPRRELEPLRQLQRGGRGQRQVELARDPAAVVSGEARQPGTVGEDAVVAPRPFWRRLYLVPEQREHGVRVVAGVLVDCEDLEPQPEASQVLGGPPPELLIDALKRVGRAQRVYQRAPVGRDAQRVIATNFLARQLGSPFPLLAAIGVMATERLSVHPSRDH